MRRRIRKFADKQRTDKEQTENSSKTEATLILCGSSGERANSATISDLRNVNKIVEKVKKEENKVVYGRVGEKEKLQVIGVVDASYKSDEKSIGGILIMIAE